MRLDRFYARMSMAFSSAGLLPTVGKLNVPVYRATRGRVGGKVGRSPVLLLTTTGRKSGQQRTTPVLYLQDEGRYVVVGSNAGNDRPPAWALNLLANPDAQIDVRGKRQTVRARVAAGEEKARLWERADDLYHGFEDYRRNTGREIDIFVLEAAST